jgi:hypothetical protein
MVPVLEPSNILLLVRSRKKEKEGKKAKKKSPVYRILGSHGGGYEECYRLRYNAM